MNREAPRSLSGAKSPTQSNASDTRMRGIVRAGVAGAAGRMVSVFVALCATPIIVRSLGDSQYGAYATITTLGTLLAFTDLGVGNGIITKLAIHRAHEAQSRGRQLIASSAAALTLIALGIAAVGVYGAYAFPITRLFHLPASEGELRWALGMYVVIFALTIPVSMGQKVLIAYHRGVEANAWLLAATLSSLFATTIVALSGGGLLEVTIASALPNAMVLLTQCVRLLSVDRDLRPRCTDISIASMRDAIAGGFQFFALNLIVAIAYQSDILIVTALLSPATTAIFALTLRIFNVITQSVTAFCNQLWPAVAQSLAIGDSRWVRHSLVRMELAVAGVALPSVLLLGALTQILVVDIFGAASGPSAGLVIAMMAWCFQQALNYPLVMTLNGAGLMNFQLGTAAAMALANVALSLFLTRSIGMAGPVLGSLISHTVCSFVPTLIVVKRQLWSEDRREA